jgi:hypothetical protein
MKKAWIDLRYEFPSIATSVSDGYRHYFTATESELEAWLSETFVVTSDEAGNIPEHATRVERTKLYLIPEKQEVIVQAPHYLLDGIGTLLLFDGLFRHLCEPTQKHTVGEEIERLPRTVTEACGGIVPTEAGAAAVQAAVLGVMTAQPAVGLNVTPKEQSPLNSQRNFLQFSSTETAAIVKAVKQKGWTVTPAVHAAVYRAISKFSPYQENATGQMYVNFRSRLGKWGNDPSNLYVFAWPISVKLAEFTTMVESLTPVYRGHSAERTDVSTFPPLAEVFSQIYANTQPKALECPTPSSFGIVEKYLKRQYDNIKVLDYWIFVETQKAGTPMMVYTWDGRLTLSLTSNVSYWDPEMLEQLLKSCRTELLEGLGLSGA